MTILEQLLEMGFTKLKAEMAVKACGENLDQTMEWLLAHQDDPALNQEVMETNDSNKTSDASKPSDGDQKESEESKPESMETSESKQNASATTEDVTAKSLKCDECGKLFKTSDEVEYHAIKSGHSSFSESTEEKRALTEEEKRQKLKDLEERMKQRRAEKSMEERKEALEREKKRIQVGKDTAEAKRKHDEMEMKKMADERRREKTEDKLLRQRIKDQIERDRLARKQRSDLDDPSNEFSNKTALSTKGTSAAVPPAAQPKDEVKKDYNTTRLQFRMSSGPPLIQSFKSNECLAAVSLWINMNRSAGSEGPKFTISTTYPRRTFTDIDMEKPLCALDLVPSAVLVVTESKEMGL